MIQPAVMTYVARKKFANAHINGANIPKITAMSFGTGGVDSNGNVLIPSPSQTTILGEFFRTTNITLAYTDSSDLTLSIDGNVSYVDPNALNQLVSTCGLWDADGDLIVIKNFAAKTIENGMRIDMFWTESF